MNRLFVLIIALFVALPAYGQTSATYQSQTTLRATTSSSSGTSGSDTVSTQPQEASTDFYLEIDGVEGESEAKKKGNVEYNWKVEEGEKLESTGIEPDEIDFMGDDPEAGEKGGTEDINIGVGELISVKAVEVRGWDPKEKQEFLLTVKAHAQVQSAQDLENFAKGVLLENETVEELSLNYEKIKVKHRSKGKLFGFIPITFMQEVELDRESDESGRVKVKLPWFSFLVKEDISASELESKIGTNDKLMNGNNTNWDFGGQAEIAAHVSTVLKGEL